MIGAHGLLFQLYCAWRFRGMDPHEMMYGPGAPPPYDETRREAVLVAFAEWAGIQEMMVGEAVRSFATISAGATG